MKGFMIVLALRVSNVAPVVKVRYVFVTNVSEPLVVTRGIVDDIIVPEVAAVFGGPADKNES